MTWGRKGQRSESEGKAQRKQLLNTREGRGHSLLASAATQREGSGGKPYEKHDHRPPGAATWSSQHKKGRVTSTSTLTSVVTWLLAGTWWNLPLSFEQGRGKKGGKEKKKKAMS